MKGQNCSVNAGVDFSICANSALTLGGGKAGAFQGAGIINWSQVSGPSAVITDPSSLNTTVTSLVGGNTYKFRLSATCSDGSLVYDEVSVSVLSISIANAGPDQSLCPGTGATNLAAPALVSGETGVWSIQGTNNGVTIVTPSSPTSSINLSSSNSGNTNLRWTISNGGCTSFDQVIITNRGGATVVTAGSDRVLNSCYSTTQSTTPSGASLGGGGVALGQSGLWTVVSGPNVPTIASPTSNNATFSNLIEGVYQFRWTVSGSCVNGSDIMQVTVPAANGGMTSAAITSPATTSGNTTSGTSNYCDGRTDIVLVGAVPSKPGETVNWTRSGSAGGTIDSPGSSTINVSGLNPGATYTNTSTFTYTITNPNGCPVSTATRTITWTAPPVLTISTASPLQLPCGTSSATINFTSSGGSGNVQWMILSGPTTPTYATIPTGWTSVGGSSVTLNGFTKPGTYMLRFQKNAGSGSGCSAIFRDFTLIVAPVPTASNAGTDQVLACNVFNTNLVGNTPTVGSGMWTQVSGPNTANMPSPLLNNTPISGLISGKYTFRWLIFSGNNCSNTQDDVSVIVADPTPSASAAGPDMTICNSTPVILTGNPVKLNETGTWTVSPSAGVSFTDNHSPITEALGLSPNTTYTFTWTISNACGTSFDNVVITTNSVAGPIPAVAGPDQCLASGTTTTTLAGNVPDPGTGTWTQISGSSAIIDSPSQFNTTVTALGEGSSKFEWSITRNTCTVTRDTVVVTISAATTIADAGADQNVCGTTTAMAGNNPVVGAGSWTQIAGPGGISIADPTLFNTGVSGFIPGAYTFRWTISNDACSSNFDDVQINVSSPPTTALAGPDQSICSGSTATMAGNLITNGTGLWTIVSGPNSPTITSPNSRTSTITGLTNGIYVIRWLSYNGAYCPQSTDDLIVDVTQAVTSATLGGNQTLCGANSVTLTGNQSTIGTWTQEPGGPNTATITANSSSTALATGLLPGIYTFRYTYDNPTSCTNTATILVTISEMPVPAAAGPDMNICDINSVTMAGNAASVGAGAWLRVSGPNAPNIVSTSLPTTSIGTTTSFINGSYVYRWTITNGSCVTSDDLIINRSSSTTVANAGPDQPSVCGTVATMAANMPAPGVGIWSQISGPNTAGISSTILPNTTITGMITGTYVFRWSITNGFCAPSTDDVSITMFELPTIADAGTDQTLCGSASSTLAGNTIITGTGLWSQISGPNTATFNLNTDPTTIVNGLIPGTYVFQWTSTNGSCASSDNVSIFITDAPTTATAGADQDICLFSPINLLANTPVVGTGMWSQVGGNPATIQTPASASTLITGVTAGSYTFRWTITNGTCPPSTDEVTITVNDLPSLALAGADQSLCNVTTATLGATAATVGTGTWTTVSGPNTPVITSANLSNTTITGMVQGTYVFDWTVANGPCTSSDQVQILISAPPTIADAGADQNHCSVTSVTLQGNTALSGTGTWTRISGPNSPAFTNANSESTTVTGMVSGTYVFRWTISNGSCIASSDNVQVIISASATISNAGPDQTGLALCGLTTTSLAGNNPVTGTGLWSIQSGTGGSFGNPSGMTSSFTGVAGSTYTLRWTITNGACSSIDDVTIIFPMNPTVSNAGADQAMCGATSALLSANTPVSGSGLWNIISGTGGSFDNTSDPHSGFSGTAGTVYVLEWNISNAPCPVSGDIVNIEFKEYPTIPSALSPQSFCKGDAPDLSYIAITGTNIKWYDASSGGNLLLPVVNLTNGTTYHATQTVNGCESSSRIAVSTTVTSCIGPVIADQTVSIDENSINSTIVTDINDANTSTDIDGDNDNITYSLTGGSGIGIFTIDPSSGIVSVVNESALDFEASQQFIVAIKVSDGLNENTRTLTIDINNLNDNYPVSVPETYTIAEGGTLDVNSTLGVLSNDTDADANSITATLVTSVSHGTLILNNDGSFTYVNQGGEYSGDSFTYKANDGNQDGNTVTVSITITGENDTPSSLADTYSVAEGGTLNVNSVQGVLSNDNDPDNDPLSAILVTPVSHGNLLLNGDGSFTYAHDGSATTGDSFTYKVNDGTIDGNVVTVTINITQANDSPIANPDNYQVSEGGTLNTGPAQGVLINDSDDEGDLITSVLMTSVSHGTLILNADGSFSYTHDGNETTSDSFTYKINDGISDGNTVSVLITIAPVNDVPVVVPDFYSLNDGNILIVNTSSGVLHNDSDAEGSQLTAHLVTTVTHGTLVFNADGSFTYTYNGNDGTTDSFSYSLNDGTDNGNPAEVIINVSFVNHRPVAVADRGTTIQDAKVIIDVLTNDTGMEDGGIIVTSIDEPVNGKIEVNEDNTITYIPDTGYSGDDEFTYQVCDRHGDCAEATVEISIESTIRVPQGFSPNGDGINDYFEIPDLVNFSKSSIIIYNRWGNIVFEDSHYMNRWDGRSNKNMSGSEILPVGTYFYIIIIQDTGRKLNGYIYITR